MNTETLLSNPHDDKCAKCKNLDSNGYCLKALRVEHGHIIPACYRDSDLHDFFEKKQVENNDTDILPIGHDKCRCCNKAFPKSSLNYHDSWERICDSCLSDYPF